MSSDLIEPLFASWTHPPVDDAAALAAFRDIYVVGDELGTLISLGAVSLASG